MALAQIGVYGLGTMGSALALNLAEQGFRVAVANRETDWVSDFVQEAADLADQIVPCQSLSELVGALPKPCTTLFMIPSGSPMDQMIDDVRPLLQEGDTIMDGGNADFNDTRRRSADLMKSGIHFVGMGVSGGEEGARNGPSMMVGGSDHSWAQLSPMVEAIAAKFEGTPCVAHVGPDGAGHFVKTVHNGIEYADMQMIAETYGVLRDYAQWDAAQIGGVFEQWTKGLLESYLIEISARALKVRDPQTGRHMVDVILDQAGQKGTGRWTVIEALKMGQSASAIEAAVGARSWSSEKSARETAEPMFSKPDTTGAQVDVADLEHAMLAGRIIAHAQGFRVLDAASDQFEWHLDNAQIAEIWRAGCIIRSSLLDTFADSFRNELPHGHLVFAPAIRSILEAAIPGLRKTVALAALNGVPVPALSAALGWFDSMTTSRGTANMIQAQRDVFGRHGFVRIDGADKVNADWSL